jgi:hypothetical protein
MAHDPSEQHDTSALTEQPATRAETVAITLVSMRPACKLVDETPALPHPAGTLTRAGELETIRSRTPLLSAREASHERTRISALAEKKDVHVRRHWWIVVVR